MPTIEVRIPPEKSEIEEWNSYYAEPEDLKNVLPDAPTLDFPEEQVARLRMGSNSIYMSPLNDAMHGPVMVKKIRKWEQADGRWSNAINKNGPLILLNRVTMFCVPQEAVSYLRFTPVHWLARILLSPRTCFSYHDAECAIRAIATFRKRAPEWIEENQKIRHLTMGVLLPRTLYECCHFLPLRRSPGLADYLFRYRRSKIEYLRLVAKAWDRTGSLKISPKKAFEEMPDKLLGEYDARRSGLALQAFLAGLGPGMEQEYGQVFTYRDLEDKWIGSLSVAPAFPLDLKVYSGKCVGRFLPRDDARGIFLGAITNCCQYPGEAADSSAWHGQSSPDGGFFVVEDRRGAVLAQSWAWRSTVDRRRFESQPDGYKCLIGTGKLVACFDSVESKGMNEEQRQSVASAYTLMAQALVEDRGYQAVLVGGDERLGLQCLPEFVGEPAVSTPKDVYSDARKRQIVIASEERGA